MASKTRRARSFELRVCEYLKQKQWRVLYHDVQVMGVQVDVLARDPSGILHLIEVKAQRPDGLARLAHSQRRRLFRVCTFLSHWEPIVDRKSVV